MTKPEQESASRIPPFGSYEEEAAFWDTHDTTDFEAAFRPVRARFAKNLSQTLNVRLDSDTLDTLRHAAKERGVGPTTLARMWIVEHLKGHRDD